MKPNRALVEVYHCQCGGLLIEFYFELPIVSPINLLLESCMSSLYLYQHCLPFYDVANLYLY